MCPVRNVTYVSGRSQYFNTVTKDARIIRQCFVSVFYHNGVAERTDTTGAKPSPIEGALRFLDLLHACLEGALPHPGSEKSAPI